MASQVLMNGSKDENERARLLSEYKYEVDLQSNMVAARRELQEKERELQEERRKLLENARSALADGASIELVCKITGFDMETVKALASSP